MTTITISNTLFEIELVRIPAGEFLMGSDPAKDNDAQPREQPQHRVYVAEFYIGKYPVTNEQYAVFVLATNHRMPYFIFANWEEGKMPAGKENHPVAGISWDDAMAFCDWLSQTTGQVYRLPTEAEWEKAARGTDGQIYPWGNEWDASRLNSADAGPGETTPVGHYSPEPSGDSFYGVADMAGNVWEWCADWYNDSKTDRALRGGAFYNEASWVRCAARDRNVPYGRNRYYGLRVVGGGPFLSEL